MYFRPNCKNTASSQNVTHLIPYFLPHKYLFGSIHISPKTDILSIYWHVDTVPTLKCGPKSGNVKKSQCVVSYDCFKIYISFDIVTGWGTLYMEAAEKCVITRNTPVKFYKLY